MIHEAISKAAMRRDLTENEMIEVMETISQGQATPAQVGALMVALVMKGECAAEISGAARVLRDKCQRVPVGDRKGPLVDTCGTGGDEADTFNVSTTAAFVAAGAGLRVAKHGNRAVSSRCGSADVLEALGVRVDLAPEAVGACIDEVGIGFLFAPMLHPAMKHAVHPRREVGLKSIFNLIGPLSNPAGADVQVLGVYRADLVETMAEALGLLGCESAIVVHGEDGLDEISVCAPTHMARLSGGRIQTARISPEDFGLTRADRNAIRGGDPEANANITRQVLSGRPGPTRDMVLLNAAAALVAAGAAGDFREGIEQSARAVDSGAAMSSLEALAAFSQKMAPPRQAAGGGK